MVSSVVFPSILPEGLYIFVVHRILYIHGVIPTGHLDGVQPKPHGIAFFSQILTLLTSEIV